MGLLNLNHSLREIGQQAFLSELITNIHHRKGAHNKLADCSQSDRSTLFCINAGSRPSAAVASASADDGLRYVSDASPPLKLDDAFRRALVKVHVNILLYMIPW